MSEDEKLLKEAKKLPWDDRLFHKNWKVRNDANIDLAALFDSITDPKDLRIREFGQFFLGFFLGWFLFGCKVVFLARSDDFVRYMIVHLVVGCRSSAFFCLSLLFRALF